MAINLLPSEEKAKVKRGKQQASSMIKMTGPTDDKDGKKKRASRSAGALTFFKSPFQAPKKDLEKEKKEEAKKMAPQGVSLKEKVRAVPTPKPKVEYVSAFSSKPKPTKATHRKQSFFSRLFGSKKPKAKDEPVEVPKTPPAKQDGFPSYRPVHAEKLSPPRKMKPRTAEVVEVTTEEKKPETAPSPAPKPPAYKGSGLTYPHAEPSKTKPVTKDAPPSKKSKTPKIHKESVWSRLAAWFKNLFTPKPKVKKPAAPPLVPPAPAPAPKPEPAPKPAPAPKPMEYKTMPDIPEPPKPAPPPPAPEPKPQMPPPEPPKPVTPVPPVPQPPQPEPPKPVTPAPIKKKKKSFSLGAWFASLWESIRSLFAGGSKSEAPKSIAPPPKPPQKKTDETHAEKAPETKEPAVPDALPSSGKWELTKPTEDGAEGSPFAWDINLVPEEVIEQELPLSKILYLLLFIFVSCGLVFGAWLGTSFYLNNITAEIIEVQGKIDSKNAEIKGHDALQEEIRAFNQRADEVKSLFDQHVYWSQVFTHLERNTIPEVYYTSMSADVNGTLLLNAVGQTYSDAVQQLYVYERATDFISTAMIADINFIDPDSETASGINIRGSELPVTFTVNLTVHPTIFYYTE